MTESRVGVDDWPGAIERTEGRQMIVAGPGTGKTEFLVRRVAHLVESAKARRDEIVVLCFSRRAAGSLQARVDNLVRGTGTPVTVTTFHSLALSIMEAAAGGTVPTVLTTPEQVEFVARTLAGEDADDWPLTFRGVLATRPFASEIADFLMRCSERLLSPDDLGRMAEARPDWRGIPGLYDRYLQRLRLEGRTDYGVLMADTVRLLAEDPESSPQYSYVLVDEYQDTTPAQAEMTRLLAAPHGNLTVAGDPYQSIYSFRGAELANIAAFGDATRIVLSESFRVPAEIMASALRVVSGADLPGAAGPVVPAPHRGRAEAYVFDQETAEAEWIATEVEHAILVDGVPPSAIAVLVRTKRELAAEISRALDRRHIPHDPPESRLVDHPAVSLVRDLVTVAMHGGSLPTTTASEAAAADRAMRRILLGPVLGLGLAQERSLVRARRRTWEPWHHVVAERLPGLDGLAALLAESSWTTEIPAIDGFWLVWSTLDGLDAVVDDPARADWRRAWRSLSQTLSRQLERDATLSLHRYFALTDDEDFEAQPMLPAHLPGDRVTLTTLHQAKGLEFETVFIANATEGVFPDLRRGRRLLRPELLAPARTIDSVAQGAFQLQEEVRLAYTAMTRARSRVVWTATAAGGDLGERRPSRFLVAASGVSLEELGPPAETDDAPITIAGVETALRRWLLDPSSPAPARLGAASVLARQAGTTWDPVQFAGVAARGPDRPVLGDRWHLSPSQAEVFIECPRRYALERRLRIGESGNDYGVSGSLVHRAFELAESEIVGTGAIHNTKERALEILDQVWESDADFGSPGMNAAWLRRARETVDRLYSNWPGDGIPVESERRVTAEIGGVEWVGYIDRLERTGGGLRIVDLKTGATAATHAEAARSIQLAFYVIAVRQGGGTVVDAQLWYPRDGPRGAMRRLDMSSVDDIHAELETMVDEIRAENWQPRLSTHCERCLFRATCPLWPEGRGAYLP